MNIAYVFYQSYQLQVHKNCFSSAQIKSHIFGNLEDVLLHNSTYFGKREVMVRSASVVPERKSVSLINCYDWVQLMPVVPKILDGFSMIWSLDGKHVVWVQLVPIVRKFTCWLVHGMTFRYDRKNNMFILFWTSSQLNINKINSTHSLYVTPKKPIVRFCFYLRNCSSGFFLN